MKKIIKLVAGLGLVLLFLAASANDAGIISFKWIFLMSVIGIFCLLISWLVLKKFSLKEKKYLSHRFTVTEKAYLSRKVG